MSNFAIKVKEKNKSSYVYKNEITGSVDLTECKKEATIYINEKYLGDKMEVQRLIKTGKIFSKAVVSIIKVANKKM